MFSRPDSAFFSSSHLVRSLFQATASSKLSNKRFLPERSLNLEKRMRFELRYVSPEYYVINSSGVMSSSLLPTLS